MTKAMDSRAWRKGEPVRAFAIPFRAGLQSQSWTFSGSTAVAILLRGGNYDLEVKEYPRAISGRGFVWIASRNPAVFSARAGSRGAIAVIPPAILDRSLLLSPLAIQVKQAVAQTQIHEDLDQPTAAALSASFAAMSQETIWDKPAASEVFEAHLRIVCFHLWRVMRREGAEAAASTAVFLVERFLVEAEVRLRDQPSVGALAEALGVSADRLTRAVTAALGRSPKQVLHDLLMREAEKLLSETTLQVDQIASFLGFSDPAYFNRFFRQRSGLPPARYRRSKLKSDVSSKDTTFAAWP
ncbi:MAG: helix-turn-helix domain-containing protein [Pseudorhizobium sp.]